MTEIPVVGRFLTTSASRRSAAVPEHLLAGAAADAPEAPADGPTPD
jgi:hypothetical protein